MKAFITQSGGHWSVVFRDCDLNEIPSIEITLSVKDQIQATAIAMAFNDPPEYDKDKISAYAALNEAWNRLGCSQDYEQFIRDIAHKAIIPN
jgi:hypothetical protein